MNVPAHVWAFTLAAICFIGAIVLVAINKTVPTELWSAGYLAAGAGAGIAYPSASGPSAPPVPAAPPGA